MLLIKVSSSIFDFIQQLYPVALTITFCPEVCENN